MAEESTKVRTRRPITQLPFVPRQPKLCALWARLSLGVVLGSLAIFFSAAQASAVIGGSATTIEQAPWQAEVEVSGVGPGESEVERCGGTIIANDEVLTAAHCLYDWYTGQAVRAAQVKVLAGTSNYDSLGDEAQERAVSGTHVHPYFSYEEDALPWHDDVAVLDLSAPLALGATVKVIELVPSGALLDEGAPVAFTGFGEDVFRSTPTGQMYSVDMTLRFPRECVGAANALFLCTGEAAGSPCLGDIGSGLTVPGSSSELVGTLSAVFGECEAGTFAAYANLAAPEIGDFIERTSDNEPPRAPQGGGAVIRAYVKVGSPVTCEPGSWSNDPTFTYTFADSSTGAVLQRGSSSTYLLSGSDVGRKVLCEVHATNAGGTGVGRTPGLGPIEAVASSPAVTAPVSATPVAPKPAVMVEPSKLSLAVRSVVAVTRASALTIRVKCTGSGPCEGKLTIAISHFAKVKGVKRRRTVTIGTSTFKVAPGTATISVKLNASGRVALASGHGHLAASLLIVGLQPTQPSKAQIELIHLEQRARSHA